MNVLDRQAATTATKNRAKKRKPVCTISQIYL